MTRMAFPMRATAFAVTTTFLASCDADFGALDFDLRGGAGQLDTTEAVRNATYSAPQPDARGVISYPEYQVAVARRGDTIGTVAARVGLPADQLARHNALPQNVPLRDGEIIALPVRVAEPGGLGSPGSGVDVTTIAGSAIARAETAPGLPSGEQPRRHQVQPGETAFSIARLYGVPVAALAEWNGLGQDLGLRVGQFLLIPTVTPDVQVASIDAPVAPGAGSVAPLPPSAAAPLPTTDERPAAVAVQPVATPLAQEQTAASDTSRLRMPVQGQIIRPFAKGKNEGIGIASSAGAPVAAADDGTVAAITRDTEQVPILVVRHEGNLLTVYAGVDDITVKKGDSVKRGQKIAEVRAASPSFLHFEVREGFDSVDPMPYLN